MYGEDFEGGGGEVMGLEGCDGRCRARREMRATRCSGDEWRCVNACTAF